MTTARRAMVIYISFKPVSLYTTAFILAMASRISFSDAA